MNTFDQIEYDLSKENYAYVGISGRDLQSIVDVDIDEYDDYDIEIQYHENTNEEPGYFEIKVYDSNENVIFFENNIYSHENTKIAKYLYNNKP